ncbi:MAG: fumarylacetoacetate hydrolase family protein [Candidatus Hydrogenedentes bacterium]|nr:fumarylacetoacetate hydrolase family protein [Candidatus Hydrogenedentota bacterium]
MEGHFFRSVTQFLEARHLLESFVINAPERFLRPFRPGKIIALGRNYAAHAAETGHDAPKEPIIFSKSPESCIGPEEPIRIDPTVGRVDPEAELGVVIARKARNVAPEEADIVIAGYTLVNDVTARDMQANDIKQGHPWFRSKSLDTFGPLGPVIALPDAMPSPLEVDIELRVNGEVRQKSNTTKMIFKVPELVAYISRYVTLLPGDLISTGTPEGIAPIQPGDMVEVTVPQIGTLRNPVTPA